MREKFSRWRAFLAKLGPPRKRSKHEPTAEIDIVPLSPNGATDTTESSKELRLQLASFIEDLTGKKGYPVNMEIQIRLERFIDFKLHPDLDFVRVYLECLDFLWTHDEPLPIDDSVEGQEEILLSLAAAVRDNSALPTRIEEYLAHQYIADRFP